MGSQYKFLETSVTNAEVAFNHVINKGTGTNLKYKRETEELLNQIKTAFAYGEIDKNEFLELSKRIEKIDYSKVSEIRLSAKESEKYTAVGVKFSGVNSGGGVINPNGMSPHPDPVLTCSHETGIGSAFHPLIAGRSPQKGEGKNKKGRGEGLKGKGKLVLKEDGSGRLEIKRGNL